MVIVRMQRDKEIIKYIEKFKVLSRDHIIELAGFNKLVNPISSVNLVMSRLTDRKIIKPIKNVHNTFLYTLRESKLNEKSATIQHSLGIADVFLELRLIPDIQIIDFEVEEYFGKGLAVPDLIIKAIVRGKRIILFLEYEKGTTNRTKREWQDKINRYQLLYESDAFATTYPKLEMIPLIILTDKKLTIEDPPNVRTFICKNVNEFMKLLLK